MLTGILYTMIGYTVWYGISRLSLLAAWMYSKPGTITVRHYMLMFIAVAPFTFELISTILIIFSVAFGVNSKNTPDLLHRDIDYA